MKQNKRMQGGIDVILNPHAPTSAELKAALNQRLHSLSVGFTRSGAMAGYVALCNGALLRSFPLAVNVTLAVSESIRELGEVPSGTLYAALIGKVNYAGYEAILQTLTNAGLIQVMPSHMIRWVGPTLAKESL